MSAANDHYDDGLDVLRATMSDLVANFAGPPSLETILESVTSHVVELIDGVDFADVLLVNGDGYQSAAPTEPLAKELDAIQMQLREGPCLRAAVDDATVVCPDLTAEPRFPRFAASAVEAGVHSMMSFQLYTHPTKKLQDSGGRGALNLFGYSPYDYTFEQRAIGGMLATYAATALIAADRQTQFESALASRDLIAQAKGIVMERFHVDATRAFQLMTKLSQDSNTPIKEIARRLVHTSASSHQ
jgi:hypothetical protein